MCVGVYVCVCVCVCMQPTEAAPNTAAKTPKANTFGNPGHTPFPKGAPPPPLDHLSPATTTTGRYGLNLFGNSPAPSGTTTSQGTANGKAQHARPCIGLSDHRCVSCHAQHTPAHTHMRASQGHKRMVFVSCVPHSLGVFTVVC